MKRILFITNGHGEDLVAATIIKKLPVKINISVLPIVGDGKVFESLDVHILGPKKKLPSGGFSLRNLWFLLKDLYAGLGGNTLKQIMILRRLKTKFSLVIGIGDIVPIIGAMFIEAPFIFIGVNKSHYYKSFGSRYTPWEKLLLEKKALKVFVRDKVTEEDLRNHGLLKVPSASYAGNPLMDCLTLSPSKMERGFKGLRIGFLPGTREDAKLNLEDFKKVVEEIIKMKNADIELDFLIATALQEIPEYMKNKPFGEVITESDLIIGLSGTGNEQAAGLGKPVVAFFGRGSQYNKKFALAQKELLGEALLLVKDRHPISIAACVWQLLRQPQKMEHLAAIGRERMGSKGAVEKIVDFILQAREG
jgi:hypothetical protein